MSSTISQLSPSMAMARKIAVWQMDPLKSERVIAGYELLLAVETAQGMFPEDAWTEVQRLVTEAHALREAS